MAEQPKPQENKKPKRRRVNYLIYSHGSFSPVSDQKADYFINYCGYDCCLVTDLIWGK